MNDTLWKYRQAAEYLQISESSLRTKVMKRQIPFYKIGGSVRFRQNQLDAFLDTEALREARHE